MLIPPVVDMPLTTNRCRTRTQEKWDQVTTDMAKSNPVAQAVAYRNERSATGTV